MRVLVVGAGGASGCAAVRALRARGHEVTAMVRRPPGEATFPAGVRLRRADALLVGEVAHAVQGHDAVIVTLGIRENPLRVRLLGSAGTNDRVRSIGTANVVRAMHEHGVQRLVVQSTFGTGATRAALDAKWRLAFALLLRPQIDDHERQEKIVRESGLDWTLLQPVGLVDGAGGAVATGAPGEGLPTMRLARASLARVTVDAVEQPAPRLRGSVPLCDAVDAVR